MRFNVHSLIARNIHVKYESPTTNDMAVGSGGRGAGPSTFQRCKKNSMVKMHLKDANGCKI